MDELTRISVYSMTGIVAIFLVVITTLPSQFTADVAGDFSGTSSEPPTWRARFAGYMNILGTCSSTKDTCPAEAFCSARMVLAPSSHLKGTYGGYCIHKYPSPSDPVITYVPLCRFNFQCQSNDCVGVQEGPRPKLHAPNIGVCA